MEESKSVEVAPPEKILAAARYEFARHGFNGARVDEIAVRAGANKAMIYYYFRSKDNLYQEVINNHLGQIRQFLRSNIEIGNNIEAFLTQMVAFWDNLFHERREFVPIFLREMAEGGERIRIALKQIMVTEGYQFALKAKIDAGIRSGEFRNLDPMQTILSFVGMNLYYLITAPVINGVWEIQNEKEFRESRQKAVVDLFLYGLKAR